MESFFRIISTKTFYQNIAVGNIKELDNEALVKEQESLADKLALKFPEGYQQWLGEDLMMELSFLAENGKSCFSQSIYERCASFNFG
jgi:hypothetical protein